MPMADASVHRASVSTSVAPRPVWYPTGGECLPPSWKRSKVHRSRSRWRFTSGRLLAGVKMSWMVDSKPGLASNPFIGFLQRPMRVTPELHVNRFFVRAPAVKSRPDQRARWSTPLFLALVLVEFVDLICAVDSAPSGKTQP